MARDMTPRQVAEAYLAAWNAHDADAAAALMADDVTYLDVTVGEPQKGRDAARDKVIKLFVTAAPDLTWKMRSDAGVTFIRVENGKIVSQSDYYDGLGFQKQLGWIQ